MLRTLLQANWRDFEELISTMKKTIVGANKTYADILKCSDPSSGPTPTKRRLLNEMEDSRQISHCDLNLWIIGSLYMCVCVCVCASLLRNSWRTQSWCLRKMSPFSAGSYASRKSTAPNAQSAKCRSSQILLFLNVLDYICISRYLILWKHKSCAVFCYPLWHI